MLLTRRVGNEQAPVAGGSMQETVFVLALRIVLRTYGVVGTKFAEFECRPDVIVNPASDLNQTA